MEINNEELLFIDIRAIEIALLDSAQKESLKQDAMLDD